MILHPRLDALNKHLYNVGIDGQTIILIVDQAALANDRAFQQFIRNKTAVNLLHETAAALDGASPLVIDITGLAGNDDGAFTFGVLLEAARWACGVSVVVTHLPFHEAVRELRMRADVMLPDDLEVVLRYFDTRILPVLLDVLEPGQRAAFTGMASAWLYLDRDGNWCTVAMVLQQPQEELTLPLHLSSLQQDALIDAGECDAVLNQMRRMHSDELLQWTPPEQYRQVLPLIGVAYELGIEATATVALFCRLALLHVGQVESDRAWQDGLCEVRDGKKTFTEFMKEFA